MSTADVERSAARGAEVATASAIVLALVAVRLIAAAITDLAPDETYYFLWSQFPSASYYDHPPMVAWWIAAGTSLFGDSAFGIRFFFVTSVIPTTFAVWLAGRLLFDAATAVRAALWLNATLIVGIGIYATPDAPSVMFWALATLALAAVVASGTGVWWLAVGLAAGFGVLSKLTDLFLGPGIALLLLVRSDLRRWLATPWPWAGALVAAAVVTPMALWNADHGWITFTKQMGRFSTGGFQPLKFLEFVATQFGVLNPLVAVFAGLAVVGWARRWPGWPRSGLSALVWTLLPLVAYMAVHSFREQVQANWPAPAVPAVALAAAAAAGHAVVERWGSLRALTFPLGVILSLVALVFAANPRGLIPPNLDLAQVARGWKGVAEDAERLRIDNGATWIATTHYALGSAIAWYLRDREVAVVPIVERGRYAFAPPPTPETVAGPALVVALTGYPAPFVVCFDEVEPAGAIPRDSGAAVAETFHAFLATGPHPDLMTRGCDGSQR